MRTLNYPYASTQCFLKDSYGNVRKSFILQNGENTIECTPKDCYYQTAQGVRFFINEGEGVLAFEDTKKQLDCSKLDVLLLDFFLQNKCHHNNATKIDKQKIEDFLFAYETNLQKNAYYFLPQGFLALDMHLTQGKNNVRK